MAGFLTQTEDETMLEGTRPVPVTDGEENRQADNQSPASTTLEDDDEAGEPNVTEEEQAAYEAFVSAGRRLIYNGGKVNQGILDMLDEDPADLVAILGDQVTEDFGPVMALAATATIVVLQTVRSAPEKPDGEIIMHGGKELLEDLADLCREVKGHVYSQAEMNDAMIAAVNLYREAASAEGMVDVEALTSEFADILNAQERGELEQILPGIGRYENGDRQDASSRTRSGDAGLREAPDQRGREPA